MRFYNLLKEEKINLKDLLSLNANDPRPDSDFDSDALKLGVKRYESREAMNTAVSIVNNSVDLIELE